MSDRYDTQDQERLLLNQLFNNVLTAQRYFHLVNEEMFSSTERRWLFETSKKIFKETGTLFSEKVMRLELAVIMKFDDNQRSIIKLSTTSIETEWNMVSSTEIASATPEWLIDDISKKLRAKELSYVLDASIDKIQAGESDEAIDELQHRLLKIKNKIKKRSDHPIRLVTDIGWYDEYTTHKKKHPELYSGLKTGYESFDNRTGGFFRKELTVISGHTSAGKSTMLRNLVHGMLHRNANVLFIVNEESDVATHEKFYSLISGVPPSRFKQTTVTDNELETWRNKMSQFSKRTGKLWIKEINQYTTISEIETELYKLSQDDERVDVVVLDYLDHLKPVEKAWGETDEQNKAVGELKSLALRHNVAMITATQADTASVEKEEMTSYSVRGSKMKAGAANVVIMLKSIDKTTDDDSKLKVHITKNRDGAQFYFFVLFKKQLGMMVETKGDTMIKAPQGQQQQKVARKMPTTDNDERGRGALLKSTTKRTPVVSDDFNDDDIKALNQNLNDLNDEPTSN